MRIFIDSANIRQIKDAVNMGMIDGVTRNPALILKEGRPFLEPVREICSVVDGPISVEAVSQNRSFN